MSNSFFTVISAEEFVEKLTEFPPTEPENISLAECTDHILATDLIAPESLPKVNRSCMDGFAVRAMDTFGAGEAEPLYLENIADIHVDDRPDFHLENGECARIPTGGTLPDGADGVVMVEYTHAMNGLDTGNGTIEIRKGLAPGDNVMLRGEDAQEGKVVLTAGTKLRPQEIGLLAALGITEVAAHRSPVVGILSTGDELVEVQAGVPCPEGKVRDVNSYTLAAIIAKGGGIPKQYGIVKDDLEALSTSIKKAVTECDLVLLSGGSSVGMRDLTVEAILAQPNSEIQAHGVAMSPGKPTILANVENDGVKTPVVGLPGQVTSVQVVMQILIIPFIHQLAGHKQSFEATSFSGPEAKLACNVYSRQGREDYIRVALERTKAGLSATPLYGRSGLLRTLLLADGLIRIPAEAEGLYEGETVTVRPF
ncbi:MAG: gephyrin-like molybdotransferase Glp [Desulfovibrio sp.]